MSQKLQVRFDGHVTGLDLELKSIKEFEVLLESEEVLGAIVAGECSGDLGLGGSASVVTVPGKLMGVGLSGHDVS